MTKPSLDKAVTTGTTKPSLDKAVTTGTNARWCQAETVPLKYELRILKY